MEGAKQWPGASKCPFCLMRPLEWSRITVHRTRRAPLGAAVREGDRGAPPYEVERGKEEQKGHRDLTKGSSALRGIIREDGTRKPNSAQAVEPAFHSTTVSKNNRERGLAGKGRRNSTESSARYRVRYH